MAAVLQRAVATAWARLACGCFPPAALAGSQPVLSARSALTNQPKTKVKKVFKGRVSEVPMRDFLKEGDFGLRVMEGALITEDQLEAMQMTVHRKVKQHKCKVHLRIMPDVPRTKKATGVRMGKGKGAIDHYIYRARPNQIILEITGSLPHEAARIALTQAAHMLAVKTRIAKRDDTVDPQRLQRPLPDDPLPTNHTDLEALA